MSAQPPRSKGTGRVDVFAYPIARRTDQFDRLGECARALIALFDELEDWTGIYVPPFIWLTGLRMPVHDRPLEAA